MIEAGYQFATVLAHTVAGRPLDSQPRWLGMTADVVTARVDDTLEMLGIVQQVKAYERLTVQAAVDGDREAGLKALLANPLVARYNVARPLLDAILEANQAHLPRFFARR